MATIEADPRAIAFLLRVLARHVPDRDVRVMGSRTTGRAKPFSDLDLVVMGDAPLSLRTLAELRDALDDSDLPFAVDIVEWAVASDGFRHVIVEQARLFRHADSDERQQSMGPD